MHSRPPRLGCLIGLIVAAAAGAVAWMLETRSADRDARAFARGLSPIPIASTRGHVHDGELDPSHGATDYSAGPGIPGLREAPAKDILVVVHGLNNDETKAANRFALARESLRSNGYEGVVIGWSWDGSTNKDPFGATGYRTAKKNAVANGPKLARFITDLAGANPDARVRLLGYSMGARVVAEALRSLDLEERSTVRVATVHLVGAALDNEELEVGERYGEAVERRARALYNYFSPLDDKLGGFFPLRDADRALGQTDIENPERAPKNYRSRDVSHELKATDGQGRVNLNGKLGANHSGYLGIRDDTGRWQDDGAMNVVAEDIARAPD